MILYKVIKTNENNDFFFLTNNKYYLTNDVSRDAMVGRSPCYIIWFSHFRTVMPPIKFRCKYCKAFPWSPGRVTVDFALCWFNVIVSNGTPQIIIYSFHSRIKSLSTGNKKTSRQTDFRISLQATIVTVYGRKLKLISF